MSPINVNRWTTGLQDWWRERAVLNDLGAGPAAKRNAAVEALVACGPAAIPTLIRALRGQPTAACAAAVGLSRLGVEIGVQTVLVRCYDEEWMTESPARPALVEALFQLDQASIGLALETGLVSASAERELQPCFDRLTLSLSALRLLAIYDAPSQLSWWERSFHYGRRSLPKLRDNPFAGLAYGLTDHVRSAALRGILAQYPDQRFDVLARGLQSEDISVMRTAIVGMNRLKDPRSLPLLHPIAFSAHHPLALEARKVIETIAGAEAASLTLVRGTHADANVTLPDGLLRPAVRQPFEEDEVLLHSMYDS